MASCAAFHCTVMPLRAFPLISPCDCLVLLSVLYTFTLLSWTNNFLMQFVLSDLYVLCLRFVRV